MLQLSYHTYRLPFHYPFGISKGLKTEQATLVVELGLGNLKGYGEATSIAYYNADVSDMIVQLEKNRAEIERYALASPERFWHFLHHLLPGQNFLISALDCAGWDLFAALNRRPLYALLGLQWKNVPLTSYTIGLTDPEAVPAIIHDHPYPIYKLKMGGRNDLATLKAVRAAAPGAELRVDANEAWQLSELLPLLPELDHCGVRMLEQPLHRDDWDGMKQLKERTNILLIADEACREAQDLDAALMHFDGINLKLSKCGGITPAISMIKSVKKAGKKLMLGGMCESIPGATILAHLLPLADFADIDGPLLLKENVGKGLIYEGAGMKLPQRTGSGIMM